MRVDDEVLRLDVLSLPIDGRIVVSTEKMTDKQNDRDTICLPCGTYHVLYRDASSSWWT